jgi:hypothetical protein
VTGVQGLFAFLLIVPFNVGFVHVGRFERTTAAVAAVPFVGLWFAVPIRRRHVIERQRRTQEARSAAAGTT